jgi:hypothetical protein
MKDLLIINKYQIFVILFVCFVYLLVTRKGCSEFLTQFNFCLCLILVNFPNVINILTFSRHCSVLAI